MKRFNGAQLQLFSIRLAIRSMSQCRHCTTGFRRCPHLVPEAHSEYEYDMLHHMHMIGSNEMNLVAPAGVNLAGPLPPGPVTVQILWNLQGDRWSMMEEQR
eukprot:10584699-Karenia_brevis.AAC.1